MTRLEPTLLDAWGARLHAAWKHREPIAPITAEHPDLTLEDAYAIQQAFVQRRLDAGERVVGKKVGATSLPVMQALGVQQPDFGWLLSGMVAAEEDEVDTTALIQPRAEGELAFLLRRDLMGPGLTNADVLAATEGVLPCFEIVDSRIRDWRIRIQDTVADNASCGMLALGTAMADARRLDMRTCGMVLERNGQVAATGCGAAVLGSPVTAVRWLANTLGSLGIGLKAGELVLSGSLAALVPVQRGDHLSMEIGGLGRCSLRFG